MEGRSKRQRSAPSWMHEVVDPSRVLAHVDGGGKPFKYVYRLLNKQDVTNRLVQREVYVLWPDDGTWYHGVIRKCDPEKKKALIFYKETDEKETADLRELISTGAIAFKEERPLDHLCLPNEIELGQEYHGKDAEGGDASSAEHSDLSDSEDDGDSDFSYESADEARPKKARRQLPESDDDAPLSQRTSTPRSGSKNAGRGKRKAQQEEEEEEDEETEARRLLARATGAPVDPPTRKSGAASAPKRGGNGGGSHDPELRGKVRSGFQQALDMAAKEIGEADAEAAKGLPATSLVASAIEDALVRLFGGTTKDYRAKMRTLLFNLKDAHNTDLRAHVLRGDITPDAFVRMTATELASKELADYRKKKEEEALKMAVLDAEAAAKFSTAAALDARDKLALPPAVVTGKLLAAKEDDLTIKDDDDDRQEPEMPVAGTPTAGKWSQEGSAGSPRSAPRSTQTQPKKEEEPESGKAASTAAAAVPIDWASIKAAAVHATSLSQEIPDIEGGMLRVPEGEDDDKGEGVRERESASPPPARSEASPSVDEALRKVFLPCPDPTAISTAVWESEIVVPGVGTYHLTADALMGCGDLATLMGNNPLQVRGRLALGKLDAFLSELHMSKHRTATLGLLRVAPGASEEEKTALGSLVEQYCSRDRTGVAESSPGIEVYLVPPGPLATRLLAVAREAEPVAVEASLPGGGTDLPSDRLLAVAIHKKELQAVPGLHRPVKRPRGGSGHGAATAAAATPQLPPVPAMGTLPQGSGASALPAGLDLSAISALAAAFGVAAGPDAAAEAQPQPEQKKERKSRWDDAIPGAPAPVSSSAPSQGMPPYGVGVPPMVPSAPAPTGPRPMASMAMQPPMQAPMQAPMQPYAPPGTAPGPGPYGPGPHQGPYPGSNGPPGADPMAHPPQGHGYPGGYPDHPGSIPMGSGYPGGPPQQHGYPQYHEQGPPGGYGQGFPSYRGGRGQMRGRGRGRGPPRGRFGS